MADSRADQGKDTPAEGSVLSDFEKWKSEKMNRETDNVSGPSSSGATPELVSRGEDRFSEWDDSRMLVPSSLELGAGSVDKYVISKQIVRMQEPRRLTPDDLEERRIIYPESSNRQLVNHFRNLRTKLLEKSGGNNFTLVVSGAREGAGSSFVALNLAAAFAFDEAKTALIIDCNLREPALHSTLDIVPDSGLTDFLDDPDYDIARILYPTGIPRLRLIPAGSRRETPGEFFTSFRMKQFLQAVRRRYPDRFIVLDTAPITESPDARILTELCDYAMLVIPHAGMTADGIEQAAGAFHTEKFVGAVING
ncbi:P-loop NTPase family protein [Marinobacter salarius]|jgi:protein-tyrosine kinase|uniref:polysaccharide biosynthesis protein n=1 Tax=Marinobacter salarius TaxID=1420917 RepID=UPI000C122850|nr:polysaccharide biosynthesis protein [Marinobacter salarius]AZR42796.1 non-specific protein-tyrosine kinase [Marinobacter salarius]PHS01376.1 MAG: polysaccharide biosynthesis protein [Leeuwenhoekiella sp.]